MANGAGQDEWYWAIDVTERSLMTALPTEALITGLAFGFLMGATFGLVLGLLLSRLKK